MLIEDSTLMKSNRENLSYPRPFSRFHDASLLLGIVESGNTIQCQILLSLPSLRSRCSTESNNKVYFARLCEVKGRSVSYGR